MAIIRPDAIAWYERNISDVSRRYESVAAETVHGWLVGLLPNALALVLDVGAGLDAMRPGATRNQSEVALDLDRWIYSTAGVLHSTTGIWIEAVGKAVPVRTCARSSLSVRHT
jgi:hypothetical protein